MATAPRDPEAEARELRAELGRLEEDMRRAQGFGDGAEKVSPLDKFRPTTHQTHADGSPQQQAELRQIGERMRAVQSRLNELEQDGTDNGIPGTTSARSDGVTASATGTVGDGAATEHPIFGVEGRFIYVSGLFAVKLANGSDAFSNNIHGALMRACLSPVAETVEGQPVIGPASLMRACLALGARELSPEKPPFTLSEAVAAHFVAKLSGGEPARERLMALVPDGQTGDASSWALADPDLTRVLADAARLAPQLTPGQARVDIRHVILALLKTPQAQRVILDARVPSNEPIFGSLFQSVRAHLESRIREDAARGSGAARDSASGLAAIMDGLKYDPVAPLPPERHSELHFVADAPARSLDEDRLGVADEARALAEVICLREPGPPLAIGLFGDWGSGKSTFMNMMEAAIAELTGRVADDAEAGRRFVTKVVSLKFNAWHYNDANLWASLTSEFFSQLRAGGHDHAAGARYAGLVKEVERRVASLESEAAGEAETVVNARQETESLKVELEGLESRRATIWSQALSDAVAVMVAGLRGDELPRMREVLEGLGHPLDLPANKRDDPDALRAAIGSKGEAVRTEIMRAAELPGRFAAFGRELVRALTWRSWKTAALLYLALLLFAVAVVGFHSLGIGELQATLARLGALGAMVAAAVAGLHRAYRMIEPIFRAADTFAAKRRTARETLERDIAAKQEALSAAQKTLANAEAERARKEAEAARFRGGRPEQVLDYFLNVSDETKRFEGELGTVSRVRRAFEQLNAICEQGRSELDRIVLYIDDLDRCQVHQVVKVLEAVHLLLAFPLFVVVVGVDSRWLQNSLLKFYEKQLRAAGETAEETVDRATVQDYLEKIFQIPVRLRPLGNLAEGGFRRYLDSVAGPVQAPEMSEGADATATDAVSGGGGGGSLLTPVDAVLKPPAETARETLERVTLRRDELDMIEALSPLLGKSPRAVKRFMNIYRLIRGLHRGAELDRFLDGADGKPATYPAVQFWLAMEIGLSEQEVSAITEVIAGLRTVDLPLTEAIAALGDDNARHSLLSSTRFPEAARDGLNLLRRSFGASDAMGYSRALQAIDKVLPDLEGLVALQKARPETQRFTLRHP